METFNLNLTKDQVEIILGLIDDHTIDAPDFFLNDQGKVFTPMIDPMYKKYNVTIQEHLNKFLDRTKLEY